MVDLRCTKDRVTKAAQALTSAIAVADQVRTNLFDWSEHDREKEAYPQRYTRGKVQGGATFDFYFIDKTQRHHLSSCADSLCL
uniref:PDEase domain-containing protein n=1 Tax=Steinernema glaseri TaxID=37863 RepID=A0A1I7XZX9_9BILA